MKCYIYFIINQITNERYVGQTTNFNRRKTEHFFKLKQGIHPNPKLQNSFNKYGEENFIINKIQFDDITKQELDEQEIYYIKKYNSFNNGFNLTEGGTGGDTRSKLSFEDFCFAYFGNKKYDGMTNKTAKYLNCDSSTISAIRREEAYDNFREKALNLSEEEKEKYLDNFIKTFDLKNTKPWTKQATLDDTTTLHIMCVVSSYGRGIESTILKHFNLSKGFIFHLMTGNGRKEVKEQYRLLSEEEIQKIGKFYFNEWNLQSYSKIKIKEVYLNLFEKY